MAMRYKLSRVLQAIADNESASAYKRNAAYTVANGLRAQASASFDDALDRFFYSIPLAVGVDERCPSREEASFSSFARKIHDLLVAEAKRLGVKMEDC